MFSEQYEVSFTSRIPLESITGSSVQDLTELNELLPKATFPPNVFRIVPLKLALLRTSIYLNSSFLWYHQQLLPMETKNWKVHPIITTCVPRTLLLDFSFLDFTSCINVHFISYPILAQALHIIHIFYFK